ncbi:MAG: hypothetical protein V1787_05000 [Candidatus Micrarchaeota archaeon]
MAGMRGRVVVLLLLLAMAVPQAKSLQDEIKIYLNQSEVATYQTVEMGQQRYIVVEVDGTPRLVFDMGAELVANASLLDEVLAEYYRKVESGTFTFRTAEDLNRTFAGTYAAFGRCNSTFVTDIEENYLWRDFKCWETGVGRACDSAIALRKALSKRLAALKPKMEALPLLMRQGETEGTFDSLSEVLVLANDSYQNASEFQQYYKYFFGKNLWDDPSCGLNPADLKAIVDAISPAINKKYVGAGANASALAQEAARRSDYSKVRALQVRGEEALDTLKLSAGEVKGRFAGYGFPTDAFDAKITKADRILVDLENSEGAAVAERQLNSLFSAIAEYNALKERNGLLLPSYSEMVSNVRQADSLLAEARVAGGGPDEALEAEMAALRQEISLANDALRRGEDVEAARIDQLSAQAASLKARAGGEEPPGLQFDWFVVIAAIIILAGAGAVWWFRIRRKGYY